MTTRQHQILVISTQPDALAALPARYRRISAPSLQQALRDTHGQKIDLIVLDMQQDGLDSCRTIKADARHAHTPLIGLLPNDANAEIQQALDAGACDVLLQPLNTALLDARLHSHLEQRRCQQQLQDTAQQLERNIHHYRHALETSRDGFCMFDNQGTLLDVNQGYCTLSGYSRDALLCLNIRDIEDPTSVEYGSRQRTDMLSTDNHLFESRHRRKDGSVWDVEIASSYSTLQGGRFYWFCRNIEARKLNESLDRLRQQLNDLLHSGGQSQLMQTALDTAEHLSESQIGFFHFVETNEQNISLQVWSSRTLREMCFAEGNDLHYPVSEAGVWVDCILQRQPVIHNDYAALPHRKGLPQGHAKLVRELTVPLFRANRIVAVIGVGNKPGDYSDRDTRIVTQIANMALEFVERNRARQRVEHMAFFDALTGLPNRELLADRIKQALSMSRRSHQLLSVCYLDLDGFKPVNDEFGHHIGDALLRAMALRLQDDLREGDTLARLGGDEFVILLNNLNSIYNGEEIIRRMLERVDQPFEIDNHSIHVSGSIGATFYPIDNNDANTLLRHADQAMYQAKAAGKSSYHLFDPIQAEKIQAHRQALQAFDDALRRGQMVLHYQPCISLATGMINGLEALIRWQHPQHGLLLPIHFLPMIEDSPQEIKLGKWVLEHALDQQMAWRAQGINLPVSVNISPRHLQRRDFSHFMQNLLSDYPQDLPDHLELEVLEISELTDIQQLGTSMHTCRQLGIRLCLDQVGSDYASLRHFHQLPMNTLKLEKGLVQKMLDKEDDLEIVEGIMRLAFGLQRTVVAVGVESVELGLLLAQLGCQHAQGHGIARPMPADALPNWLNHWRETNIWHRLSLISKGPPPQHYLNVPILSHRLWLEQIALYLRAEDDEIPMPNLDEQQCQFQRWYLGIGRFHFGKHPSYPFILPKHNRLHTRACQLLEQAKPLSPPDITARLDELEHMLAELTRMLNQLAHG
jgi:diguanylate cyclase (GGDEF)-like protein/PAS domain S-box-containing protein